LGRIRDYNARVELRLREYRGEDFETLWNIDQSCFPPGIAYSRHELESYLQLPRSFALVGEWSEPGSNNGMQMVGFIVAQAGRNRIGHLITIDVLLAARRSRVGSQLLESAERRLQAEGCTSVYLETAIDNRPALAFYKRHGYFLVKTVPRYYGNALDAFVLQKDLHSRAKAV
jgi:ribosomal protein S18 acetylase RimI-like enzyme